MSSLLSRCVSVRRSGLTSCCFVFATFAISCAAGCRQDSTDSKRVPSRWIKISVAEGQADSAVLSERACTEIQSTIPTVTTTVPERFSTSVITGSGKTRQVIVCGTLVNMQELLADAKSEIVDGQFFDNEDGQYGHRGIVISEPLAKDLFPSESAVGKTVSIKEREFKVAGVLGTPKGSLIDLEMADVYMSMNPELEPAAFDSVSDGGTMPSLPLNHFWLKVGDLSQVKPAKEIAGRILKRKHPDVQFSIVSEYEVN